MKLFFRDGTDVETDINPEVPYVIIRAVQKKHAEAKIKAKMGWREFYVGVENADVERTFSVLLIDVFCDDEEEEEIRKAKPIGAA